MLSGASPKREAREREAAAAAEPALSRLGPGPSKRKATATSAATGEAKKRGGSNPNLSREGYMLLPEHRQRERCPAEAQAAPNALLFAGELITVPAVSGRGSSCSVQPWHPILGVADVPPM